MELLGYKEMGEVVKGEVIRYYIEDPEYYDTNPNFFDPDMNIATLTGHTRLWPGSKAFLKWWDRLSAGEVEEIMGRGNGRVVELGAGLGVVGMALAKVYGYQVFLTDVETHVDHILKDNVALNFVADHPQHLRIFSLNWLVPISEQMEGFEGGEGPLFLGVECLWLKSLCDPFFDTLHQLLRKYGGRALVTFTDRSTPTSTTFSNADEIHGCMKRYQMQARRVGADAGLSFTIWLVTL